MNKNFIYLLLALFCVVGCNDDEPYAEPKTSNYDLSMGDEASVQRSVYDLYKNYNTILILNPEIKDYRYNFENVNNIRIVNADEQYHKAGIDFLNEIWLSKYSEEFKKANNLPYSIILCDSIFNSDGDQVNVFASHGFVAIAGLNKDLASMTDETKAAISKEVNYQYLGVNMMFNRKDIVFPNYFYSISAADYMNLDFLSKEDLFSKGFVRDEWPAPDRTKDALRYIEFITKTSSYEIILMTDTYPKIKEKYNIVKQYFLDKFNLDITNLNK
ncbi:MAG: hypothetical protein N4A49_07440 [Marinifilaceae bacterium]|jgi:hypothetical protein|nr:hypothetical protein [Marinifilaceae bacterium]